MASNPPRKPKAPETPVQSPVVRPKTEQELMDAYATDEQLWYWYQRQQDLPLPKDDPNLDDPEPKCCAGCLAGIGCI